MSFQTIFFSFIGLALAFYIFYYRYGIRNWFYEMWYGEEKYEHIKVIRYPKNFNGNWEKKLQNAMEYFFEYKYSFTPKERENVLNLLASVDLNKCPQLANLRIIKCPTCKKTVVVKFLSSFIFNHYAVCPNCSHITYNGELEKTNS